MREYRTQDEILEAGYEREIARGLYLTTLAELEWESRRRNLEAGAGSEAERDSELILQAGVSAILAEGLQAELDVEYDPGAKDVLVDELILAAEREPVELEIGKDSVVFGEYFSRFTTGPLLELGETTATGATLSYDLGDRSSLALNAYDGRAGRAASGDSELGYAAAFEIEPFRDLSLGASYISDLADSDEKLLSDSEDISARKAPAVSGYALWKAEYYEVTFEYVAALRGLDELDADRDQPSAWNVEVGVFALDNVDLAFRLEGSRELDEAPEVRAGIAATWLFHDRTMVAVEALQGRFKKGFAADDNQAVNNSTTISLQLLIAF